MHAQRMATLNVLIRLLLMEINGWIGGWLLVVGCWLDMGTADICHVMYLGKS
jgi:hypothetical protein